MSKDTPVQTSTELDGEGPSKIPEVYWIQDLAQLRALADPLRVRILEAMIEEARTTKQVAVALGEKPTKLYHHVDALEKAGLIRLFATKPNRGTLEKYFRAVARLFRADPTLFSSGKVSEDEVASMGADLLAGTAEELRGLKAGVLEGRKPMIVQAKITAGQEQIDRLQARLEEVLREFGDERLALGEARRDDDVDYRLALALFPIQEDR